jgi:hypothetical protein
VLLAGFTVIASFTKLPAQYHTTSILIHSLYTIIQQSFPPCVLYVEMKTVQKKTAELSAESLQWKNKFTASAADCQKEKRVRDFVILVTIFVGGIIIFIIGAVIVYIIITTTKGITGL